MTTYTLFGQPASPATIVADTNTYTMGMQFSASADCSLTAIWFHSASGAGNLPQTIGLYSVVGETLVHSEGTTGSPITWSGATGSGWVRAAFSSPPSLTAGASYKGCVFNLTSSDWYSATSHYWDSGTGQNGITSGILSAPNNNNAAAGQDSFFAGGTSISWPNDNFNATNYWVDVEVSTGSSSGGSGISERMTMSTIMIVVLGEEEEDLW